MHKGPRFTLIGSDEKPPVDDEPDFGRRYDSRDACTPCWYDNCAGCRGSGCACRTFNHPNCRSSVAEPKE